MVGQKWKSSYGGWLVLDENRELRKKMVNGGPEMETAIQRMLCAG